MNLSQTHIEKLGDAFRSAGFSTNDFIIDNDYYCKLTEAVLDGLGLKITNEVDRSIVSEIKSSLLDYTEFGDFVSSLLDVLVLIDIGE